MSDGHLIKDENSVLIVEPLRELEDLYREIVIGNNKVPVSFHPTTRNFAPFCAEAFSDKRINFYAALVDIFNYDYVCAFGHGKKDYVPCEDLAPALRCHSPEGRIIFIGGDNKTDRLRKENAIYRINDIHGISQAFENLLNVNDREYSEKIREQIGALTG